jgi:NADH dehydrogenase (ubiquinone) Fe-S protein 3
LIENQPVASVESCLTIRSGIDVELGARSKADNMHKYGSWLMGCLPKYIQQFSVWKDELTIYICPSGVIPVFSFLKCKTAFKHECLASVADCS